MWKNVLSLLMLGVVMAPPNRSNTRILRRFRLQQPDTDAVQDIVEQRLANESAIRSLYNATSFARESTPSQYRSFTSGSSKSLKLGYLHRPKVIELEATLKVLGVSTSVAKRLITVGFGPSVKCPSNNRCDLEYPYRTADGRCNNPRRPNWGSAFIPMRRWLRPDYSDSISEPRGGRTLPSARLISTTVHTDSGPSDQQQEFTHMLMQWGQFLDHDITRTPTQQRHPDDGPPIACCDTDYSSRPECFPIELPSDDPHFNETCMNFIRSVQVASARCRTAPVEQLNEITAYIDASQVYGSSQSEQDDLRTFTGGELREDSSFMPRRNDTGECDSENTCFKAGDERVNENPTLQSMHTIFMREHNRIAGELKNLTKDTWKDEKLFQESRKIVGAVMQKITYGEYLPIVLGPREMVKYDLNVGSGTSYTRKYRLLQDASIKNAFATAAFRMGHSMIRDTLSSIDQEYNYVASDNLSELFSDTSYILKDPVRTLDHYTRGLVHDCVQKVDMKMTSEVTNNLFKDNSEESLDLAALNIQRGRDHGLPGYIYWRRFCGSGSLPRSFSQLSSTHSQDAIDELKQVYSNVEEIDLFPGALSERPAPGSLLGPTFSCLLGKQFQDLKQGDRFWFEENSANVRFTPDQLKELRKATLSRVICDNTDTLTIQKDAFIKDVNKIDCTLLPTVDLTKWIVGIWGPWSPWTACFQSRQIRTRVCSSGSCQGTNSSSRRCFRCPRRCWFNPKRCRGCTLP